MAIFALTGGIAAGKSTVSKMFADLGAYTLDADVLARTVVAPGTSGLRQIGELFGAEYLTESGELDRAKLAAVVFSDAAAKQQLEEIVHPAVAELLRQKYTEICAQDPTATVIYEIPLLLETGQQDRFDGVILVTAPEAVRKQRLCRERHLTSAAAEQRLAAQTDDAARLQVADWVIDTSKSRTEVLSAVREVYAELSARQHGGTQACNFRL